MNASGFDIEITLRTNARTVSNTLLSYAETHVSTAKQSEALLSMVCAPKDTSSGLLQYYQNRSGTSNAAQADKMQTMRIAPPSPSIKSEASLREGPI